MLSLEIVGTGAYSEVFSVTRKSDNMQYALKQVSRVEVILFLFAAGQNLETLGKRVRKCAK